MAGENPKSAATKTAPEKFNFEVALKELESIVVKMEKGELTLEESLKFFERGIALTRQCQQVLQTAEHKVQILQGKDDAATLTSYQGSAKPTKGNDDDCPF